MELVASPVPQTRRQFDEPRAGLVQAIEPFQVVSA
jgi:hypothetical protein